MILGLIGGSVLRSSRDPWAKTRWLTIAGLIGVGCGLALGWLGICPVVKRIWTPSWVLFSGGWCFLFQASFYLLIEIRRYRHWAFPLAVVGMNSIAAYLIAHLFDDFIARALPRHFGRAWFTFAG